MTQTTRVLEAARDAVLARLDALPRVDGKLRVVDVARLHRELLADLAAGPGGAEQKGILRTWLDALDPRHHSPPVPVVTVTILRCPHCTARKPRYDGRRGAIRRYVCRACGLAFKAREVDPLAP